MNISAPFIRRPVGTTLLTAAIALAGAVAYLQLPVAPLPQVDFPTISVGASLPGASPEIMASSVAAPLERQLGHIAGVNEMTSSSALDEVISFTPAMWPSCRSSGAATDDAMISGLAPGSEAPTLMVGKSTCGRGATGNCR